MWACLLHPRRLWRCSSRDSTRILGKVGVLPNPHNPARWLLQAPASASAWACYRAKGINRTIVRAEPLEPTLPLDRQPCHVTTTRSVTHWQCTLPLPTILVLRARRF